MEPVDQRIHEERFQQMLADHQGEIQFDPNEFELAETHAMVKAIWKSEPSGQEITLVYDPNEGFVYASGFSDPTMLKRK